ncbi:hypothetical protein D9M72_588440 [compost metagenome]
MTDRLRHGIFVQRPDSQFADMAPGARCRPGALRMRQRLRRHVRRIEHAPCAGMLDEVVDLARRQARIGHHCPGIAGTGREHQHGKRGAVLGNQQNAVPGAHA